MEKGPYFVFAMVAFVCIMHRMAAKKAPKANDGIPSPDRSQVVRLRKGQAQRLAEIGDKFGTTQGQLVSWAIDALVAQVEAGGGKLVLPFTLPSEQRTHEPQ